MTRQVAKAQLYKLKVDQAPTTGQPARTQTDGAPVVVQFNPTSLKLTRSNNVDRSGTTRDPARQNPSAAPATLTFDLEFDTAEGDASGKPFDVRDLTKEVRQFVEPPRGAPAEAPPRVLFRWGPLNFPGIITQLTEDIDYFSAEGMALRAKLSVTITEQDLAFEINEKNAGSRRDSAATRPGSGGGGAPGSSGTSNPTRTTAANAGESLQQLLSRLNENPSAWRSAMNGLSSPVGLAAGAQVQVAAGASAGVGLGASAGFGAGASAGVSVAAALGVSAGAGFAAGASAGASAGTSAGAATSAVVAGGGALSAGAGAGAGFGGSVGVTAGGLAGASARTQAGFVLAAAGGIGAASNLVVATMSDAAVASARSSFAVPAAGGLSASLGVSATVSDATGAAVDPRSVSYGAGVPLAVRPSAQTAWDAAAGGTRSVSGRSSAVEIGFATGVGPAWEQLPRAGRLTADREQRRRDVGPTTMRWSPGR